MLKMRKLRPRFAWPLKSSHSIHGVDFNSNTTVDGSIGIIRFLTHTLHANPRIKVKNTFKEMYSRGTIKVTDLTLEFSICLRQLSHAFFMSIG